MLVSCSKCGKLHPRGYKCGTRTYRQTNERELRSKYVWTKKAKQIKDDAMGLCEVCREQGIYTYDGLEVHHITKLKDDPNGLLDDNNLICLCVEHHKQADEGKIAPEYLREIAKRRVENVL